MFMKYECWGYVTSRRQDGQRVSTLEGSHGQVTLSLLTVRELVVFSRGTKGKIFGCKVDAANQKS